MPCRHAMVEGRPNGTALTIVNEMTVHPFRERITYGSA